MRTKCPKRIYFGTCPICGSSDPFHGLRVISLLSSVRKGSYLLWCKNKKKFERYNKVV
jgi:hypothetical protein